LFMAIALASAEYNFDKRPYMFVLRECVVQDDGSAPFFVGLYKEECDDVAAADRRLNYFIQTCFVKDGPCTTKSTTNRTKTLDSHDE
jgi:hypothetical protein